ncbi:hypothetical protein C8J56DRAFT_1039050 [Mycena floridula]|nr:hypothetical protein C8J56DRAFT_1039050 [Mycena floridula]
MTTIQQYGGGAYGRSAESGAYGPESGAHARNPESYGRTPDSYSAESSGNASSPFPSDGASAFYDYATGSAGVEAYPAWSAQRDIP